MKFKNRKELYARDPLLPEVLEFAVTVGTVNITSIQRRFRIGYPRASRLIDILQEEGFIEEMNNGPRKVLLSQEEFCKLYGGDPSKLKEEEESYSDTPKPKKGQVKFEELKLDKVKFFDEFDKDVSEETAKELNKIVFDVLCNDALINLSSDFLLDFLKKKDYKIKFVKFDFNNISETFRVEDKISAPVIYIIDIANGSIVEVLKHCSLLVKEGAIVLRKIKAEKSMLTILF